MKVGILGMGVAVVMLAGWPQPAPSYEDRSLLAPMTTAGTSKHDSLYLGTPAADTASTASWQQGEEVEDEFSLSSSPTILIDLNLSSRRELETLPGIGVKLADRIVAYRSIHGAFQRIGDLVKVAGIGDKRLQRLAPFVTVKTEIQETQS